MRLGGQGGSSRKSKAFSDDVSVKIVTFGGKYMYFPPNMSLFTVTLSEITLFSANYLPDLKAS